MTFWTKVFRAFTSLAPRFKREYGDEAARDYARMVARESRRRGRAASIGLAFHGAFDALRVSLREVRSDFTLVPRRLGPDARQTLRIYSREPLLALAITATLAIAVGPTTAIYAVVHDLLLAPLPYDRPERLVTMPYITGGEAHDYGEVGAFFSTAALWWSDSFIERNGQGMEVPTLKVTSRFFQTLGMPLVEGRQWQPHELDTVVVTRSFAEQQFGLGAPVLGRVVTLDGLPRTVVGVLPTRPILQRPGYHVFVPYPDAENPTSSAYGSNFATFVARLDDGASIQAAQAQVDAHAATIEPRLPSHRRGRRHTVIPLEKDIRRAVAPLWLVLAPVVLVFVVALFTLAGLLLARAVARLGETSVRLALGATRGRLLQLAWMEAFALAVPGVAAGTLLAMALLRVARARIPPQLLPAESTVPGAALAFGAAGVLVLATLTFAAAPCIVGRFNRKFVDLRSGSSIAGMKRARSQSVLAFVQVGLSVALIAAAFWISSGLNRLLNAPLGFEPRGLVLVEVSPPAHRYSGAAGQALLTAVLERLAHVPGVTSVAATSSLPAAGGGGAYHPLRVRADEPLGRSTDQPAIHRYTISPEYFRTMQIPVLEGRAFSDTDRLAPDRAVIISRSAAARHFPEGAIGKIVAFSRNDRRQVVGIVADVQAGRLGRESPPQFYLPMRDASGTVRFVLRASGDERSVVREAGTALGQIDPLIPVTVRRVSDYMQLRLSPTRLASQLGMVLGGFSLLLALVNVYALSALGIAQRRREIGLRIALGADAHAAVAVVMRRGLFWSALGLLTGAVVAWAGVRPSLQSVVPGGGLDALVLLTAVAGVAVASVLASWLPARRAALIDPAITLKAE